jgi:hypothetical protein
MDRRLPFSHLWPAPHPLRESAALFLLGPHRVICGNATDPDLVNG